ncbi:uncharacterized protein LOC128672775 isoform X2 [Plodia interpunctella]|nr:uncharacterized protein LOC128672775 isoform X2 [Plodia interpunctella]XP_053606138.1 uncharacterized protein LOC128672775 isoform X2 [Plodia interpunctella]XP_053606139.1 uncharacterized protein LOC128672775 isoform X2 [Plodia interpunctella]
MYNQKLESKYTDAEKEKILKVINDSDAVELSRYELTKARLKKITQWKSSNGILKSLCDMEVVEGFSERTAKKLFDSILVGPQEPNEITSKIKGQFLHPTLSEIVRQKCESVLTVYVSVNSICWCLICKNGYEVVDWKYNTINYPDGKKMQITDILNISWTILQQLPLADIYVMQAEATTLRAAGSDPNNPKLLTVNLQKAQMVSMIVALINARSNIVLDDEDETTQTSIFKNELKQKVYFLRPTLPYRLYGTLVGNEKVSTDQTVEMLLQDINNKCENNSHVYMSDNLKNMFRSQKDLQKDMLGHCLLLSLTFMDLCIYKNENSVRKLLKKNGSK